MASQTRSEGHRDECVEDLEQKLNVARLRREALQAQLHEAELSQRLLQARQQPCPEPYMDPRSGYVSAQQRRLVSFGDYAELDHSHIWQESAYRHGPVIESSTQPSNRVMNDFQIDAYFGNGVNDAQCIDGLQSGVSGVFDENLDSTFFPLEIMSQSGINEATTCTTLETFSLAPPYQSLTTENDTMSDETFEPAFPSCHTNLNLHFAPDDTTFLRTLTQPLWEEATYEGVTGQLPCHDTSSDGAFHGPIEHQTGIQLSNDDPTNYPTRPIEPDSGCSNQVGDEIPLAPTEHTLPTVLQPSQQSAELSHDSSSAMVPYGPSAPFYLLPVKNKRRRGVESDIPYTNCFMSRPPPKRARKQTTEADQAETTKLRLRGSCLRCRLFNRRCSNEDPCKNCRAAFAKQNTVVKNIPITHCLRRFTDFDFFDHALREEDNGFRYQYESIGFSVNFYERSSSLRIIRHLGFGGTIGNSDQTDWRVWASLGSQVLHTLDHLTSGRKLEKIGRSDAVAKVMLVLDCLLWICLTVSSHENDYYEESIVDPDYDSKQMFKKRPSLVHQPPGYLESCRFCADLAAQYWSFLAPILHAKETKCRPTPADKAADLISRKPQPHAQLFSFHIPRAIESLRQPSNRLETATPARKSFDMLHSATVNGLDAVMRRVFNNTTSRFFTFPLEVWAGDSTEAIVGTREPWELEDVLHEASDAGSVSVTKLLLQKELDLETLDDQGRTALYMAALAGHETISRLLIQAGVNIEARDREGYTPLHFAVEMGREPVSRLLIQAGANIVARDLEGHTQLHLALRACRVSVSRLLLEEGGNLEARTRKGSTPLRCALKSKCSGDLMALMIARGAKVDSDMFWMAAHNRTLENVTRLLEAGALRGEIEHEAGDTGRPIHWCSCTTKHLMGRITDLGPACTVLYGFRTLDVGLRKSRLWDAVDQHLWYWKDAAAFATTHSAEAHALQRAVQAIKVEYMKALCANAPPSSVLAAQQSAADFAKKLYERLGPSE